VWREPQARLRNQSGTLKEPVRVSEETKEYILPQYSLSEAKLGNLIEESSFIINNIIIQQPHLGDIIDVSSLQKLHGAAFYHDEIVEHYKEEPKCKVGNSEVTHMVYDNHISSCGRVESKPSISETHRWKKLWNVGTMFP
jgi:hypothetical protein